MNDLPIRVITGTLVFIFILLITLVNKYLLIAGVLILSILSIIELENALKKKYNLLLNFSLGTNIIFILFSNYIDKIILFFFAIFYFLILFTMYVFDEKVKFESILSTIFVFVYISMPYTLLVMMYDYRWVLFSFLISAVTDTSAYFAGSIFGKHKLIERLSPKKTVEGSIGGILGAILFTIIFVILFKIEHNFYIYIIAILVSAISQVGDLFASHIKRDIVIKDYSNILKAHGGIMDRFDSLLFVAPLIYILDYLMRFVL